jgi:hypothetical protein
LASRCPKMPSPPLFPEDLRNDGGSAARANRRRALQRSLSGVFEA